jgi:hypothetical protein
MRRQASCTARNLVVTFTCLEHLTPRFNAGRSNAPGTGAGTAFALVQLGDALADLFLSDDALAAAVTPETFLPHLASPGPLPVPPPAPAIGTKCPVICVCERHAS